MFETGKILGNRFKIVSKITEGGFGSISKVFDMKDKKDLIIKQAKEKGVESLEKELVFYKYFSRIPDYNKYIPKIKQIHYHSTGEKIIMMNLFETDVGKYVRENKVSKKEKVDLTIKMLEILKFIHNHGYIHGDVKMDNFVISDMKEKKLLAIDFGLSQPYIVEGKHIKDVDGRRCGTLRYMSIPVMKKGAQSRRSDLESLAYCFIYLFEENLPWRCFEKKKNYKKILEAKENFDETKCEKTPREYKVFMTMAKTLDFKQEAFYDDFINAFKKLYDKL